MVLVKRRWLVALATVGLFGVAAADLHPVGTPLVESNLTAEFTAVDAAQNVLINSFCIPASDSLPAGSKVTIQSIGFAYRNNNHNYLVLSRVADSTRASIRKTELPAGAEGEKTISKNGTPTAVNWVQFDFNNVEVMVGEVTPCYLRAAAGGNSVGEEKDLRLVQPAGFNALRKSNYPAYSLLYEIKYTVSELPYIASIGGDTAEASLASLVAGSGVDKRLIVSVNGDVSLTADEAFAAGQNVYFVASEARTVTIQLTETLIAALRTKSQGEIFTITDALGVMPTVENVTFQFANVPDGYLSYNVGGLPYIAKKTNSISLKTGAQSAARGQIGATDPNVGPYPIAGVMWNTTPYQPGENSGDAGSGAMKLKDGNGVETAAVAFWYQPNTYHNHHKGNAATTGNGKLTVSYFDDSPWTTQTFPYDINGGEGLDTYYLTSAVGPTTKNMGWQIGITNIPYQVFDLYVIPASDLDEPVSILPIAVKANNGEWKFYAGNGTSTVAAQYNSTWPGARYCDSETMVEGTNYLRYRFSAAVLGLEEGERIEQIFISHPNRNDGGGRLGLAGIQIVEVEHDGIYTRKSEKVTDDDNWFGAGTWENSSGTAVSWENPTDGDVAYAIIDADNVDCITLDGAVTANSVRVTSTGTEENPTVFTIDGNGTLNAPLNMTGFVGAFRNPTFTHNGTITFGANSYLEYYADADEAVVSRAYDIIGSVRKTGAGTVKIDGAYTLPLPVAAGTLEFAIPENETATQGGDISGAGALAKSGAGTLVISGDYTLTGGLSVNEGTVKLGKSGNYSIWNAATPVAVQVENGASFDVAGHAGFKADVTLEAGATFANSGEAIGTGSAQTHGLILNGDATVDTDTAFGLLCNGHNATTLNLGAHTLTKTGSGEFYLCNTTVSGTGTIDVQAGTLSTVVNSVDASSATINLADGAKLKITSAISTTVTGSGVIDIARTDRTGGLVFAEDNNLTLRYLLANDAWGVDKLNVTLGGGAPARVEVVDSDGEVRTTATSTVNGTTLTISVKLAPETLSRVNPVTGESTTFTYAYLGTDDLTWKSDNMRKLVRAYRWTAVDDGVIPLVSGGSDLPWQPTLIDGDLIATNSTATLTDGKYAVTAGTIEGWNTRLGLFNNVSLTINKMIKFQNGGAGLWFMVDKTSKLVIKSKQNHKIEGLIDWYVEAPEGVVFECDLVETSDTGTMQYSFKGEGSLRFDGRVLSDSHTSHTIKAATIELGEGKGKKVCTKPLVSFASSVCDFSWDDAAVTVADSETVAAQPFAGEGNLTTDSELGTYRFVQTAMGVELQYVGRGPLKPLIIIVK